jgi:hypothetical protein
MCIYKEGVLENVVTGEKGTAWGTISGPYVWSASPYGMWREYGEYIFDSFRDALAVVDVNMVMRTCCDFSKIS